jgi:hypothetical protein
LQKGIMGQVAKSRLRKDTEEQSRALKNFERVSAGKFTPASGIDPRNILGQPTGPLQPSAS